MHKILDEKVERVKIVNDNVHNFPFVISIPHSGLYLTDEMNNKLKEDVILSNMDWYLPELYSFLEEMGFTMVINNVSRYVIDPNRNVKNVGFEEYTKSLIYKKTPFGKDIYNDKLSQEEINDRINSIYNIYHETLEMTIAKKLLYFNKVYLIDLHSFGRELEADVVLGNDNGRTINLSLFQYIQNLFIDSGFSVTINKPFSGGYITKYYGDKGSQCESLQIELSYYSYIDKRLFYEEELPEINQEVMKNCQKRLKKVFTKISQIH